MTRARDIANYGKQTTDLGTQAELDAVAFQSVPYIIPGVLYPAVEGNDLNGTDIDTSHGSTYTYGTAHADGRKYYYTDIKGSKPIKDPRIGAHFGSQRYPMNSIQLLEQETATHGTKVYSVDGREWLRGVGDALAPSNTNHGNRVTLESTSEYWEITGYFSSLNLIHYTGSDRKVEYTLDGGSESTGDFGLATVISPLGSRYIPSGSVVNILSTTLGIHTVKLRRDGTGSVMTYGIELIAQDTSNVNHIQIPSQNVVSYGKKFTVSETPHYNPFAFKTDGTTAWTSGNHNGTAWPIGTGSSANIDTATSLGLDAWVSTNYYYPYNGGRVVWWVDSSGTLKCSVNMMPPNARSIANSASLTNGTEKGDDSAGTTSAAVANNTFYPTFTDQAIDHSQAEVAKTFNVREFGNGAANCAPDGAGDGVTDNTYADASMLNGADDIAYVMDDGLTSLSADDAEITGATDLMVDTNKNIYITFIGTGISVKNLQSTARNVTWFQNLPYGTHVVKITRISGTEPNIYIDGVEILDNASVNNYGYVNEVTFHQPKKPPIPENAVVLADYMLMADFVAQGTTGIQYISKGVRSNSVSRDVFVDGSAFSAITPTPSQVHGLRLDSSSAATSDTDIVLKLPSFATQYAGRGYDMNGRHQLYVDGSSETQSQVGGTSNGSVTYLSTPKTLGTYDFQINVKNTNYANLTAFQVATPIHTSSHYQSFETPFLHELVGGDRNMEQTNLVVTPDGKTWDEVTRDTSYIGNMVVQLDTDSITAYPSNVIFDQARGSEFLWNWGWKDSWVLAYDRLICLKDGFYNWNLLCETNGTGNSAYVQVRINEMGVAHIMPGNDSSLSSSATRYFKKGDYLQIQGVFGRNSPSYSIFQIEKTRP